MLLTYIQQNDYTPVQWVPILMNLIVILEMIDYVVGTCGYVFLLLFICFACKSVVEKVSHTFPNHSICCGLINLLLLPLSIANGPKFMLWDDIGSIFWHWDYRFLLFPLFELLF